MTDLWGLWGGLSFAAGETFMWWLMRNDYDDGYKDGLWWGRHGHHVVRRPVDSAGGTQGGQTDG